MDTLGNPTSDDYNRLATTLGGITNIPEQNAAMEQRMKLIEALRDKGPAGHMAGPNVYVGNNALQSLAPIAQAYAGKQLNDQMMTNANKQGDARNAYMQMMLQQLRAGGRQGSIAPGQDMSNAGDAQNPQMQVNPDQDGGNPYYA